MRRLLYCWHHSLSGARSKSSCLQAFAMDFLAAQKEVSLRTFAAAANNVDALEDELSSLSGGLRQFFTNNADFRVRQDHTTGEIFVRKSLLKSDSGVAYFWKSFDIGLVLPFVPSYFVPWVEIFERLPEDLRRLMPKEQRSRNIVGKLMELCEFNLGWNLLARRKSGLVHPAVDEQADQMYRAWQIDPDAVARIAAKLSKPVLASDVALVAGEAALKDAGGDLGIRRIADLYPTLLSRYTLGSKRIIESLLPHEGSEVARSEDVMQGLVGALKKSGKRANVETVVHYADPQTQGAIALTGVGPYVRGVSLTMDKYGFVHQNSSADGSQQLSMAGQLVRLDPSSLAEVGEFSRIDTSKRWSTKRRVKERDANSIFRNESTLLAHLLSVLSETEYIALDAVALKLDHQAKCWLPDASILKFTMKHLDVLDYRQTFEKSTTYWLRKRRLGEKIEPQEKVVFNDEELMAFVMNACASEGTSLSSLWAKIPLAVREQVQNVQGLVAFLTKSEQFDIIPTTNSYLITPR